MIGKYSRAEAIEHIGVSVLKKCLAQMMLIRHFEIRAEAAYQNGEIGGFFHSYIGQEAIQTSVVAALGVHHWYTTSYRCHALALLLGCSPNELMAELFGRVTGNAKGRGGSMHFFAPRLLGGFGIVGGQIPIATGAAFSIKYQNKLEEVSVCFLGDGAVAQGSFHESLNLASLWNLPALYVIENNLWGMGTSVKNAIAVKKLAEDIAPSYGMEGATLDGMDVIACIVGFEEIYQKIITKQRPMLVEVVTERFKGHSISDPGLYRSKECLKKAIEKDPIIRLKAEMLKENMITENEMNAMDVEMKERVLAALEFAKNSPMPDPILLEEDVYVKNSSS